MDPKLLERVATFSPPWVRYMLTLSEMSRTGDGWVVASGDDLSLWATDGGPVLPIWPTEELAAAQAEAPAEAAPIGTTEFMDSLLPFLRKNEAALALFPNLTNDVLVDPDAVAQDLTDFVAEPDDVGAQIAEGPRGARFGATALLEMPEDVELPEHAAGTTPPRVEVRVDASAPAIDRYRESIAAVVESGWIWVLDAEDSLAGIVLDEEPALAVFPTREYADAFAALNKLPANARAIPVDAFVDPWLVIAFAGSWDVAVAPAGDSCALVTPPRLALDLSEALVAHMDAMTGLAEGDAE